MFGLRIMRVSGMSVTVAVHRLVNQGRAAQRRQDWAGARTAYAAALRADGRLGAVWVQLGHVAKEDGDRAEAARAYAEAARLRPGEADPHLQLGHLFYQAGDWARAAPHYLEAARANPALIDAATALHRSIARARGPARADLLALLQSVVARDPEPEAGTVVPMVTDGPALTFPPLTFDVSDLVLYFAHGRAPTGIQRVQIQIVTHALRQPSGGPGSGPVRLCCFIDGRDAWLEVPVPRLLHLARLSTQGSDRTDPAWVAALNRLHLDLAMAPDHDFPGGGVLVNLGSSWELPNYFLFVRAARARFGIRYVPFVHDLIPIVAPQHFLRAARQQVVPWVLGVLTHADQVLVNSESTKRDLVRVAAEAGLPMNPDAIAVIRLDADFRTEGLVPVAPRSPAEPFALFVSTVESRKGHATAFDAWAMLIARHGAARVPPLVCVGKQGWLSAAVYRRLEEDPVLASRVVMRSGVSDEELAGLYQACSFTIYPSSYEGWGLPITEALSYGKPVIAADTSSLPEAGGDHAVYVPPGDAAALADAVERMAFDAPYREGLAARIAAGFRPRRWADLAAEIRAVLTGPLARLAPAIPMAVPGAYHPLSRSTATRIWPGAGVGEVFRTGTGWAAPGPAGCDTRPGGGRLTVPLPPGCGPVRVGLLLLGPDAGALTWQVQMRDGPFVYGTLARDGRTWVTLDQPVAGGPVELLISGEPDEALEGAGEGPCVGLAGFFVHAVGDTAAERRLLYAVALNDLEPVDAYGPPPPPRPSVRWD